MPSRNNNELVLQELFIHLYIAIPTLAVIDMILNQAPLLSALS
jgi:hypothetical protein